MHTHIQAHGTIKTYTYLHKFIWAHTYTPSYTLRYTHKHTHIICSNSHSFAVSHIHWWTHSHRDRNSHIQISPNAHPNSLILTNGPTRIQSPTQKHTYTYKHTYTHFQMHAQSYIHNHTYVQIRETKWICKHSHTNFHMHIPMHTLDIKNKAYMNRCTNAHPHKHIQIASQKFTDT